MSCCFAKVYINRPLNCSNLNEYCTADVFLFLFYVFCEFSMCVFFVFFILIKSTETMYPGCKGYLWYLTTCNRIHRSNAIVTVFTAIIATNTYQASSLSSSVKSTNALMRS